MKNENGIESGVRDAGRGFGTLCLSLIPWALAIGAAMWFGVYMQAHEFFHILSQEKRASIYTAAPEPPGEHIKISVLNRDCTKVKKVDLDGSNIIIYGQNDCRKHLDYFEWHWQELSPNGTVIGQDYTNWRCPDPSEQGDVAECKMTIPDPDDRTLTLRVWTQTTN